MSVKATSKRAARAKPSLDAKRNFETIVVEQFAAFYQVTWSKTKILKAKPNDFDLDPAPLYEALAAIFGVEFDDAQADFGGMGGPLRSTVTFIANRWDGVSLHVAHKISYTAPPDFPAATEATPTDDELAYQPSTKPIDCDEVPAHLFRYYRDHFDLRHQLPRRVTGHWFWNRTKQATALYVSPTQRSGRITGSALRLELEAHAVLPAQVLDWLLAHPEEIPLAWRACKVGFWGSIFNHNARVANALVWNGCNWVKEPTLILEETFGAESAVAIAASLV